ncbi:MAG: hypothetical protein IPM54_07585 [Polyangiaceae bacterium]|nr:hypothetical protein [Polyangiaceae bacterium]
MNFRLFGIDVEIEPGFWFIAVIFGLPFFKISNGASGLIPGFIWVLVVLVSVLVHELGHAFAIRRHRIQPEITLYMMGGKTVWRALLPLKRTDHIIISLAGPFAGFFLAALVFAVDHFVLAQMSAVPFYARFAVTQLLFVNVYWGIFNLIPVLPLDGGHVLEHALGPKRLRMTAIISMVVGFSVALYFLQAGSIWAAFIFGMGAFQSLRLLQVGGTDIDQSDLRPRAPEVEAEPAISGEILSILSRARQAVADEDITKARALCNDLLARDPDAENAPPPNAKREALEILAWASLLAEQVDDASAKVDDAKKLGEVDPALLGAVHFAKRETNQARRVLEAARARGDDRKEVVGPLIQILIEQGEVARAAAIAYDIVDSLSEDDARKMAQLAFDNAAFDWSARLYETVFERQAHPEDAYEAARAHAQDGAYERAIDMLRKAVGAGFNDRARVWSDKALEALRARDGLDGVVPRP